MKEKKNIDNLFKAGISGYKIEPSGQVWQNIESGFFGKKGFLFYKWYYLAAAVLLLLTAGGIWYFNTGKVDTDLPITNGSLQSEMVEIDDKITEELSSTENEPRSPMKVEIIEADNNLTKQLEDTNSDKEIPDQSAARESTSIMLVQNNASSDQSIDDENSGFESEIYTTQTSDNISIIDARSTGLTVTPETNMIDPQKVVGMEEYLEKQRNSHFYTGASISGGMVYYPSTEDQFTWSAELAFGITAGRFYVETGVAYQDMKERGIYTIDLKSYDSVGYYNRVESFEVDPSNPDEILYNTKTEIVYDSIDHYTHSTPFFKYQYINIPLSVGFKFFQKEKFTASVQTGVLLSMLTSKNIPETEYYDPDYTVVRIHNMTPERVDWNLIWQIGIRLNYKLHKSLSVSAEPVFTKYLNSVYDTDKGYTNIKPYTMGLRVGVYYGF